MKNFKQWLRCVDFFQLGMVQSIFQLNIKSPLLTTFWVCLLGCPTRLHVSDAKLWVVSRPVLSGLVHTSVQHDSSHGLPGLSLG